MLLDGPALVADPDLAHLMLNRATLRQWAHRGWIARRGVDPVGRVLYDYDEVVEFAEGGSVEHQVRLPVGTAGSDGVVTCSCGWASEPTGSYHAAVAAADQHRQDVHEGSTP